MKINFCISGVSATGGIRCIFEYANGLMKKGHEVTITIPCYVSKPTWFDLCVPLIMPKKYSYQIMQRFRSYRYKYLSGLIKEHQKYLDQKSAIEKTLLTLIPICDFNIATDFPSALPVYLSKRGIGCYFMQHYERLFAEERPFDSLIESLDADDTYRLPLFKIANSTWLKNIIEKKFNSEVYLCCNGVNLDEFYNMNITKNKDKITIVSFSGNSVVWKGFKDAVQAMKMVFNETKDREIVWKVFGGKPELSSEQAEVPFDFVGKIYREELTRLYNEADIVFLASWYESFPLPPIEAMACGAAVITTQYGTDDYAIDGNTALVVSPKDPRKLADAILYLINYPKKRVEIANNGRNFIQKFNWQNAVNCLENILIDISTKVKNGNFIKGFNNYPNFQ